MDDIIEKIESMEKIEKDQATSLSTAVEGLDNILVRGILRGIARDSEKHAVFYNIVLSLLKNEGREIAEEDYNRIERIINRHIEVEKQMMQKVKQLMQDEQDSRVKHLLAVIYEDEDRHHTLMKRLLEMVIKRESLFKEDEWDKIWKDLHSL